VRVLTLHHNLEVSATLATAAVNAQVAPLCERLVAAERQIQELKLSNVNLVRSDEEDVVEMLIDKGANVDDAKFDGRTPLGVAAQKGMAAVVRVLLAAGAKIWDLWDGEETSGVNPKP